MRRVLFALGIFTLSSVCRADSPQLPQTVMTLRGRELYGDSLELLPKLSPDKAQRFASGFKGWRFNLGPEGGKSGRWEQADKAFRGIESPGANHPATASYGMDFTDVVIQVDFRLNDVPAEGRKYRSIFLKVTDEKDYVCGLFIGQGGMNLVPYSSERINPANNQRDKDPQVSVTQALKLNEWYTVVFEIKGDEAVGTLGGKTVKLKAPLIGAQKCSVMLGVGTDASFRNLRIWEGLPNPEWSSKQ